MYQSINDIPNETAFYVFDINELVNRIEYLKSHLIENIKICYAVKANSFVIKEMNDYVDRFEICSEGESKICDILNINSNKTVISGINKNKDFIEELIKENTSRIFTIESLTQYKILVYLGKKYGKKPKVLLRLTNNSQFGINKEDIEKIIIENLKEKNLDILGFQYFSGTQKTSIKKIQREINEIDELISYINEKFGFIIKEFEYGPGFPYMYFKDDKFDELEYLKEFSQAISNMKNKCEIIIELGRSLVSSCGKYYTHVVDMKSNAGVNYLIVDGGMHHIEYYGQFMAIKTPHIGLIPSSNEGDINEEEYCICGSLCSMNDILVKKIIMPRVLIGDIIYFENVGAYCVTECIALFLSRDIPSVYLYKDDKYLCVRKSLTTIDINLPKYNKGE